MDPHTGHDIGDSGAAEEHPPFVLPRNDLPERFARLREQVLIKRPILRNILQKKGNKPLLEYAKEYVDVNLNPTIPHRQKEICWVLHEMLEERFGKETADSMIKQLESYYFVSMADHTGPITNPFFVNANLLIAASLLAHSDPVLQNILVLSCANITSNNHTFPRGLTFHSLENEEAKLHRMSFLSANSRSSIYSTPAYGEQSIKKIQQALDIEVREGTLSAPLRDKVRGVFDEIYAKDDILNAKSYSEQVGKTNVHLWSKFFEKSNVKMPNLLYLEQEEVTVKLITNFHLYHDTIINHVLFDPRYEPFINDYFEGIFGSFSRAEEAGTYLFWAQPKGTNSNLQLWRKGNYLVSKDESYKIELHPERLREAMESKELIPSLLLNFMVICFYYGLKCLGGFNQVNYLTLMKNSYIKMNVDLGNYRSIEICARAQTREICDGLSIAFMGYNGGNKTTLATGLDLILYGQEDSWSKLMDVCTNMTVDEAINPQMPEIYHISYDKTEWEADLVNITEKQINELTGLDTKITPCIYMNT